MSKPHICRLTPPSVAQTVMRRFLVSIRATCPGRRNAELMTFTILCDFCRSLSTCRWLSSWILGRVVSQKLTDVSEVLTSSIIRAIVAEFEHADEPSASIKAGNFLPSWVSNEEWMWVPRMGSSDCTARVRTCNLEAGTYRICQKSERFFNYSSPLLTQVPKFESCWLQWRVEGVGWANSSG
jgi:hypothetical protein